MAAIYINKRPIKIAFLINPQQADWQEQVDAISDFCQDKWGGRYYPLVPTDGKTIDDQWWKLLQELDPDYVISVFPLDDALLEEVRTTISPIDIEVQTTADGQKPTIFTHNEGLLSFPNSSTVNRFRNIFSNNVVAAIRGIRWSEDIDVFRFQLRNFGIFENTLPIDSLLSRIEPKETVEVTTKTSLADLLKTFTKRTNDYIYPIQFSMFEKPPWYVELENAHADDNFGLILGDTFTEQLFLRNKVFFERDSSHRRINHLWLPKFFYEDLNLMEALGNWLRRVTQKVHLFSFSIPQADLMSIADRLDAKSDPPRVLMELRKNATSYVDFPFPAFSRDRTFSFWDKMSNALSPPKEADFLSAVESGESIAVISPSEIQGFPDRGFWMAEVFIEADNDQYYNQKHHRSPNRTFWWQLPRKNYLARDIFETTSRINRRGIPVVQLPGKKPTLSFKLPSGIELLSSCVVGDIRGRMTGVVARRALEIDHAEPSNIGKYLTGFLEVFGGLILAYSYLGDRYWRDTFDFMSGSDVKKEANLMQTIRGKLKKVIRSDKTKDKIIEDFENLSDSVADIARQVNLLEKNAGFKQLLKSKIKEHKAFKIQHNLDYQFKSSALRNSLSDLLELGVLQMGVSQKCSRCGSLNWYSVDEIRQHSVCIGCRFEFSIRAQPEAAYRLSSLVRTGIVSHGLVPVALVLGQILADSRSSFFFAPSLNLYRAFPTGSNREKPFTDADVLCITDGRLVMGEIKHNQKRFEEKQMLALAEAAETIRPDFLFFSSLDSTIDTRTERMIEAVKERLKDSNISVGWYALDADVFDPSRGDC